MNDYSGLINELESMDLSGAFVGLGIFLIFIMLIFLGIFLILYILQSIALYKLAEKNNIANAWLAWIPIANMYLLGKLGFEVYAPDDKKNEVFTWVLLGCSAASWFFDGLSGLASLAVIVFSTWAYYYIFNKINNKNAVLFTVLTAIFQIGGLILFFNRKNFVSGTETIVNEPVKETVKEENKEEATEKPKYCAHCGNKVNKTSKFCSKCGSKL